AVALVQAFLHPLPESFVAQVPASDGHEAEGGRQQTVAQQVPERGEQVAFGEVARGAEEQQGVVHRLTIPKGVGGFGGPFGLADGGSGPSIASSWRRRNH